MADNRTTKMMEWIAKNPQDFFALLDGEATISLQDCLKLVEELEANESYELIVILLEQYGKKANIGNIKEFFTLRLAAKGWAEMGTENVIKLLKNIIRECIRDEMESNE